MSTGNAGLPDSATAQTLVLLNTLEVEIERVILRDPGSDAARTVATLATRLLRRAIVNQTTLEHLRAQAVADYSALLPKLRDYLDAGLYAHLADALTGDKPTEWASLEAALNGVGPSLLKAGSAEASKLAGALFGIDARVRRGKEEAWIERSKPQTAPDDAKADGVGLSNEQQQRLLGFIKECFIEETALRIVRVQRIAGGFSKLTMFIHLEGNLHLPGTLVMRWDGPYASFGSSVKMEYPVIEQMYAHKVAVPRPFALEGTGTVLERPFILLGLAHGSTMGDFVVTKRNPELALDLARQVALIHAVPLDSLEDVLSDAGVSVAERLSADLNKYEAIWNSLDHRKGFAVTAALIWLRQNIALADGPRAIVHCDLGPHNSIADGNTITAILDWEACAAGTPLEDLGGLYYSVSQMIEWDDFLAKYEHDSGRRIDRRQLDYFILMSSVRMASLVNGFIDPVFAGKRVNITEYYLGEYLGEVMIERISSRMAELLS